MSAIKEPTTYAVVELTRDLELPTPDCIAARVPPIQNILTPAGTRLAVELVGRQAEPAGVYGVDGGQIFGLTPADYSVVRIVQAFQDDPQERTKTGYSAILHRAQIAIRAARNEESDAQADARPADAPAPAWDERLCWREIAELLPIAAVRDGSNRMLFSTALMELNIEVDDLTACLSLAAWPPDDDYDTLRIRAAAWLEYSGWLNMDIAFFFARTGTTEAAHTAAQQPAARAARAFDEANDLYATTMESWAAAYRLLPGLIEVEALLAAPWQKLNTMLAIIQAAEYAGRPAFEIRRYYDRAVALQGQCPADAGTDDERRHAAKFLEDVQASFVQLAEESDPH